MVSMDKIQKGVANYLDKYLLPQMPVNERIIKGGLIGIYLNGLPNIASGYMNKAGLDKIGVVSDNGEFDIDVIGNSFINQINACGQPLQIEIPFIGQLTIDSAEINNLLNEIKSVQ